MYFPYFITYITIGFAISIVVFIWAYNNGQFKNQQRARFLPLTEDLNLTEVKSSRLSRLEAYALFILAIAGLGASAAVLVFALITSR